MVKSLIPVENQIKVYKKYKDKIFKPDGTTALGYSEEIYKTLTRELKGMSDKAIQLSINRNVKLILAIDKVEPQSEYSENNSDANIKADDTLTSSHPSSDNSSVVFPTEFLEVNIVTNRTLESEIQKESTEDTDDSLVPKSHTEVSLHKEGRGDKTLQHLDKLLIDTRNAFLELSVSHRQEIESFHKNRLKQDTVIAALMSEVKELTSRAKTADDEIAQLNGSKKTVEKQLEQARNEIDSLNQIIQAFEESRSEDAHVLKSSDDEIRKLQLANDMNTSNQKISSDEESKHRSHDADGKKKLGHESIPKSKPIDDDHEKREVLRFQENVDPTFSSDNDNNFVPTSAPVVDEISIGNYINLEMLMEKNNMAQGETVMSLIQKSLSTTSPLRYQRDEKKIEKPSSCRSQDVNKSRKDSVSSKMSPTPQSPVPKIEQKNFETIKVVSPSAAGSASTSGKHESIKESKISTTSKKTTSKPSRIDSPKPSKDIPSKTLHKNNDITKIRVEKSIESDAESDEFYGFPIVNPLYEPIIEYDKFREIMDRKQISRKRKNSGVQGTSAKIVRLVDSKFNCSGDVESSTPSEQSKENQIKKRNRTAGTSTSGDINRQLNIKVSRNKPNQQR